VSVAADFLPFTRPSIDEETIADVAEVLRSGWITTGPRCKALEAALSERFGGRPVRLASSATAALEFALRVAGVGPGDEVITTPLSWVATGNVILAVGATPVFVDVDPATRNIDLAAVHSVVTPRSRAILPVDLAGLPVDRDHLRDIAQQHHLRVIEDAAQSLGAHWGGREIGGFGDLVSFSFHANKNITTAEGGCLVVNNEAEALHFEKLRLQGVVRLAGGEMDCELLGGKANMTDVAAAIGLGQLRRLDAFNQRRAELARRYFERFPPDLGFTLPLPAFGQSNWHMFQPLLPGTSAPRPRFIEAMREQGIAVGVHYPAMHLFSLYRALGYREGTFPNAESIGRRIVTLPLFPGMRESDVDRVCAAVTLVMQQGMAP
jgi:dTDP-4-amino-4,6-dideoxygalactose transaminase